MSTGPLGLPKTLQIDSELVLKIIEIIDCCHFGSYPDSFSEDVELVRVSLRIKMLKKIQSRLYGEIRTAPTEMERLGAEKDFRANAKSIAWHEGRLRAFMASGAKK